MGSGPSLRAPLRVARDMDARWERMNAARAARGAPPIDAGASCQRITFGCFQRMDSIAASAKRAGAATDAARAAGGSPSIVAKAAGLAAGVAAAASRESPARLGHAAANDPLKAPS